MLRDIITNKWFLGGIGFLVAFSVACILWYQYDTAPYRQSTVKSEQLTRNIQLSHKTKLTSKVSQTEGLANEGKTTSITETQTTVATPVLKDIIPVKEPALVENTDTTDVAVSPYGFGPYPDLPAGWSDDTFPSPSANHELIRRVMIKLLTQGVNVKGAGRDDSTGLIYPNIAGVVYITWIEETQPDGSVLIKAGRISGDPATVISVRNQAYNQERFSEIITENIISKDIEVISHDDGGIDPYNFLDIEKE